MHCQKLQKTYKAECHESCHRVEIWSNPYVLLSLKLGDRKLTLEKRPWDSWVWFAVDRNSLIPSALSVLFESLSVQNGSLLEVHRSLCHWLVTHRGFWCLEIKQLLISGEAFLQNHSFLWCLSAHYWLRCRWELQTDYSASFSETVCVFQMKPDDSRQRETDHAREAVFHVLSGGVLSPCSLH